VILLVFALSGFIWYILSAVKDITGEDSPLQRNTRKGYERMALILEDVLALYVFEHPEQEEDLNFVFSNQVDRKAPEAFALRLKGYQSLYAFLGWCLANKYLTQSEFKSLLKAYRSLVNTLCDKMKQAKYLQ
jgi:hypothetical protein